MGNQLASSTAVLPTAHRALAGPRHGAAGALAGTRVRHLHRRMHGAVHCLVTASLTLATVRAMATAYV